MHDSIILQFREMLYRMSETLYRTSETLARMELYLREIRDLLELQRAETAQKGQAEDLTTAKTGV